MNLVLKDLWNQTILASYQQSSGIINVESQGRTTMIWAHL